MAEDFNTLWSEEEDEERDPLFNALDLITMEGLDRPSYIEDPEEALLLNQKEALQEFYNNQKEALQESYNLHGTIGPNPMYDEEGNIIPIELWGPDLSFAPLISKTSLAKIPASLKTARTEIPRLLKIAKEEGISTAWDELGRELFKRNPVDKTTGGMSATTRAYINTRKAIQKTGEVVRKVKNINRADIGMDIGIALENLTKKPSIPVKFKDWLLDQTPHKWTVKAIELGKKDAIEDIAGLEGFKRFMHLNPLKIEDVAGKDVSTSAGYDALYRTFNLLVRSRIQSATANKMARLEGLTKPFTGGYAQPYSEVPFIALKEGRHGPKWGAEYGRMTGLHESTHIGGLQNPRDYKELQIMAEQSGMKLNTREGHEGLKWLDHTFFGPHMKYGNYNKWQEYYSKKLQPYLRGDYKMTPLGEWHAVSGGSKYYLIPGEVSARMAEIRRLRKIEFPTTYQKNLLQRMENRELEYMTEEGLDYAVNKLWMAAPVMTDEEIYEDLK